MTDRKISSTTTDFTIPRVSGNEQTKEILIRLSDTSKYDVYQKDLPANLPAGYDWINSFGIKARKNDPKNSARRIATTASDPYPATVEPYIIELDDVAGKEPVYFDGAKVQNFPAKKVSLGNARIQLTLALGDPPIGWPK